MLENSTILPLDLQLFQMMSATLGISVGIPKILESESLILIFS